MTASQQLSVASIREPGQKTDASQFSLIDSTNTTPPPTGAFITDPNFAPFAVVDVRRILIAHQSDASSPETKSNLLANIKRTTATRARLRHLEFVFDSSDQTLYGTPAFINPTNGALDLTDEVLKELAH